MSDPKQIHGETGASDKHYQMRFNGVLLDPYRILSVYGITHPAHQHALKKLLQRWSLSQVCGEGH